MKEESKTLNPRTWKDGFDGFTEIETQEDGLGLEKLRIFNRLSMMCLWDTNMNMPRQ